jgi:hypothetical protein
MKGRKGSWNQLSRIICNKILRCWEERIRPTILVLSPPSILNDVIKAKGCSNRKFSPINNSGKRCNKLKLDGAMKRSLQNPTGNGPMSLDPFIHMYGQLIYILKLDGAMKRSLQNPTGNGPMSLDPFIHIYGQLSTLLSVISDKSFKPNFDNFFFQ